ncbi:hypothetical protein QUF72_03670 [Desulfobacterales bacterium HSG2]|nr:hypothetical protein [Desulfobacterales bacterium HSG2]
MFIKKTALIVCVIILLIAACSASKENLLTNTAKEHNELRKEFDTAHGFTVVLTERWTEVPKDFLEKFRLFTKQIAGKTKFPESSWDYAYQVSGSRSMFKYPFILIHVEETGKVSEASLKESELRAKLKEGLKKTEMHSNVCKLSDAELGESFYDSDNHILFSEARMNIQDTGTVVGLSASRLTERGVIHFMGYALEPGADRHIEFYKNVVRKIKLSELLAYRTENENSASASGVDLGKIWFSGMTTPVTIRNLIHYTIRRYDATANSDIRRAYRITQAYCSKSPNGILNLNVLKKHGFNPSQNIRVSVSGNCEDFQMGAFHVKGKIFFAVDKTGKIYQQEAKNLMESVMGGQPKKQRSQ